MHLGNNYLFNNKQLHLLHTSETSPSWRTIIWSMYGKYCTPCVTSTRVWNVNSINSPRCLPYISFNITSENLELHHACLSRVCDYLIVNNIKGKINVIKTSGGLRHSLGIIQRYFLTFRSRSKIFGGRRIIFGSLRKSSSSAIFGRAWVNFGSLKQLWNRRNSSGDLRES